MNPLSGNIKLSITNCFKTNRIGFPAILSLMFSIMTAFSSLGQPDLDWWCLNVGKNVNCTGSDQWIDYITISPAFMGPNALPIPEMAKGRVNNEFSFELGSQLHFSNGDDTQNIFTQLNYNFAKDIISIKVYAMPREWFQVTDETRDKRKLSREFFNPDGAGKGDIYFGFEMQILKDRKFPDMMLRAFTKTTSGSNTGGARFTDSPGYFFDLSVGRKLNLGNNDSNKLNLYSMLGFYVWQTYDNINPQNDAALMGFGGDFELGNFVISNSLSGYFGWKNNGDDPMVYRAELRRKNEKFDYLLQFQNGINDYPYKSVKLSLIYHIDLHSRKEN